MADVVQFGTINTHHLVSGKYYLPIYHMDIEVFPHWWSIEFKHGKTWHEFTSDNYDLNEIRKIVKSSIITAYYGKGYDFKILYAILNEFTPEYVFELSKGLVNDDEPSPALRKYLRYNYWSEFNFIDLMDDVSGSLKEHEANMGIKILESGISWDKEDLTEDDKKTLLEYNRHDVIAQEEFYKKRLNSYFLPKIILAELYDLDPVEVLKDTNAKLTARILDAKHIKKVDTIDTFYQIPPHTEDYIKKYVPERIIELYTKNKLSVIGSKDVSFKGFENKGKFGKGGIHSVFKEYLRVTNDKFRIFLIDVKSYYPNLMIHFEFLSRAVRNPKRFAEIYGSRLDAKKLLQKLLDKAYKLILNTTFGAQLQKFNALYDPNRGWSITITGQLLLYALANELWQNTSCKIIQTNTDGIVVAVKEKDVDKMKHFVSKWEEITKLEMDYEEIKIFAQANVNNYTCEFIDGKTKVKGALCMQAITADETAFGTVTHNNLDMRIVHEAVFRFLIYKEPIEQTVRNCQSIKYFISTTKCGSTYDNNFHYINGKPYEVQRVNRVIAVKDKKYGTLKKYKKLKNRYDKIGKISNHCYIMNEDLKSYKWDDWKELIDYDFYISVAHDKIKKFLKEEYR